ncbi:MAG: hypothetical protein M1823_007073, partial [Watsoniomyces obsoletus]
MRKLTYSALTKPPEFLNVEKSEPTDRKQAPYEQKKYAYPRAVQPHLPGIQLANGATRPSSSVSSDSTSTYRGVRIGPPEPCTM